MNKDEPLVLCLTNTVAANFTANCLLAVGAKPAMIEEPEEASELVGAADALLVNLGTVTVRQAETMRAALNRTAATGIPWVLDPVGIQFLSYRRNLAREFVRLRPSMIRGNHAETEFLGPSGVPVLSTGETDRITDSDGRLVRTLSGGVPLLQSVTATGCAQGGICAAFLGRGQSPLEAAVSAGTLMKRAGERAFAKSRTPGSFRVALLDALWELTHA